uniref:4-aminobutyrate--2-oxoglutarate transaminase n=1 Tax=Macrostomum lignano TaxID=282301 RepID=A0A1I8FQ96_9PLAT
MSSSAVAEPAGPSIRTDSVPGPRSKQLMEEANKKQLPHGIYFLLTTANPAATNCGLRTTFHNSNRRQIFRKCPSTDRPWEFCPPSRLVDRLNASLLSVAPKGLSRVQTMMCGSCANENAIKMLFMRYMAKQRAGRPVSQQELDSTMLNELPGTPRLSILSFKRSFHGRTWAWTCRPSNGPPWTSRPTNTRWSSTRQHNAKQEKLSLVQVEETVNRQRATEPVAGLIVEPILAEGGDIHARPEYFKALRSLCSKLDVPLLVDEVQTGGGLPPDAVTFSKRTLCWAASTSATTWCRTSSTGYNTWLGSPAKSCCLRPSFATIKEEKLMDSVLEAGTALTKGLGLSQRYPQLINSPRGLASCALWTSPIPTPAMRLCSGSGI